MRRHNPDYWLPLNFRRWDWVETGEVFHNLGVGGYFKKQSYCLLQVFPRLLNCFPLARYLYVFAV